jgi:hypothetical protein
MEAFALRASDSLPPLTVSPPSPIENSLYVPSHQGLVMEDLPDNFLNPLKLFFGRDKRFPKIAEDLEGVRRE